MSQPPYPPSVPYSDPSLTPANRSNGWAVASLICGILGCIPISQLLAIVFGIVGIRRAKVTQTGTAMSVVGLILGLLFTLGWAGCGGSAVVVWFKSKPVIAAAQGFLHELNEGKTDAAHARCTSLISADEVKMLSAGMAAGGPISDITTVGFNAHADTGGTVWELDETVTFQSGTKVKAHVNLIDAAGGHKVQGINFPDGLPSATATPPAGQTP